MAKKEWSNLTQGPVFGRLLWLSLPLVAGSLVEVAYSMTDMFWVSRLGDRAVAAVGTGGMVMWFLQGVMALAHVGVGVEVAARLGARRPWAARRSLEVGLMMALFLGLACCVALLFGARGIVAFFKLNDQVTRLGAGRYLRVVGFGLPFYFVTQVWAQAFVARGDSRSRFLMSLLGLGSNMILDPLFILTFGLGEAGAALATALSMAIACGGFFVLRSKHRLFTKLRLIPQRGCFGSWVKEACVLLRLGVPNGVQVMAFAGLSMVISRLVAGFGDLAVAAQRVGANVESISWATAVGFGSAVTAMVAQNRGAGAYSRVWRAFKAQVWIGVAIGAVGTVLFGFYGPQVAGVFLSEGPSLEAGASYLKIVSVSQIFMIWELTCAAAFAGMGRTLLPSVIVIIFTLLRLPLAYILTATPLGLDGIWVTVSASTVLKGLILTVWFWCAYHGLYSGFKPLEQGQFSPEI